MEKHIVFKGGDRPSSGGFATPHIANSAAKEPTKAANDSLGSIHRADARDTEPRRSQNKRKTADPKAAK